ncbi:apolipoprotein B receptor [Lepus europaeus]|uniref:apolipoprotein B receptor n=1 Tax=Lepus europaeus TaxID=9983 RepID=UPI002B4AA2E1|nr:apolipoprotein B receptor [Lepus europaeus]
MDFLRLYLPGLRQAWRGALDSFSAFVSYLMGDEVPTVEREARAATELGEVVEEEAQEALEGLSGSPGEAGGEVGRCQEERSATEQPPGWGEGSSHGSWAERQAPGAGEAAQAARCQELSASLEHVTSGAHRDSSSQAQERQEPREQEVSRGELPRIWEQDREEEEVRAGEPGMARGAEPEWTWHREPEGTAGAAGQEGQEMAGGDIEETEEPGAKKAEREEGVAVGRSGPSTGAEAEDGAALAEEEEEQEEAEACAALSREEAELLGVRETAYGPVQREKAPETQALGAEGPTAGGEAAAGQEEAEEGFGGQASQLCAEAAGRQGPEFGADAPRVQEAVRAEEAQERGSQGATETEPPPAKEAHPDADLEAAPETRPEEEEVGGERKSEEVQRSREALGEEWGSGGQDWKLMGGAQIPAEQPEEERGAWGEPGSGAALSGVRTEECSRDVGSAKPEVPEADAWENQRRDIWEERGNAAQEVAARGQALEAEAKDEGGGEIPGNAGGEWERAKETGCGAGEGEASEAQNQEVTGSHGTGEGTGWFPGQSEARETADRQWEAVGAPGVGCRPQEGAQSLQDSGAAPPAPSAENMQDAAVPGVSTAEASEGTEREAFERGSDSVAREEAGGGQELVQAAEGETQAGQEFGPQGSAEEVTGREDHTETWRPREEQQAEVGASAVAEGSDGMGRRSSGSQAARAEELGALVETLGEEWKLLEEAGGRQASEQSEGWCGVHRPEGEAWGLPMEGIQVTGDQRVGAEDSDPEGMVVIQSEAGPPPALAPPEALGDAGSSWSEDLLPGVRLDVSVPRSRALLSRSSSQRRSRPSFRRTLGPKEQEGPPSPQPEEGPSAPAERLLQAQEPQEPSPPRPEGTPVPTRRPLGQGFGLAHPGMMQELQARLGRPKPQ